MVSMRVRGGWSGGSDLLSVAFAETAIALPLYPSISHVGWEKRASHRKTALKQQHRESKKASSSCQVFCFPWAGKEKGGGGKLQALFSRWTYAEERGWALQSPGASEISRFCLLLR